jgi:hypothetical protein
MKRIVEILTLACVVAGAAHLNRPPAAHATMAPTALTGVLYCCTSLDRSKSCCFWTGCMVTSTSCVQMH